MQISPEGALGLIGSNYQIASLVLVYHLFAIQHWLTRLEELCDDALSAGFDIGAGDITTRYQRNRCHLQLKNYPWLDVWLLFALLVALAIHSWIASGHLAKLAPQGMGLTPLGVMFAAYAGGSILALRRGRAKVCEVDAALGDSHAKP
jgi:hypothetical protein